GAAPVSAISNHPLYRWAIQEPAYNPTVTVDTNVPSYTDPLTGRTQTDPFSNTIYVAWNTNATPPTPTPFNFNANAIKLLASNDGGLDFTSESFFNDGAGNGNLSLTTNPLQHFAQPALVVSQGNQVNGGAVPGGEV